MSAANPVVRNGPFVLLSLCAHLFFGWVLLASSEFRKSVESAIEIQVLQSPSLESILGPPGSAAKVVQPKTAGVEVHNEGAPSIKDKPVAEPSEFEAQLPADSSAKTHGRADPYKGAEAQRIYLERIRSRIDFHKTYPKVSRSLKEAGVVQLQIEISKSGEVQKVVVIQSSGFRRLDEAAIRAVGSAAPFDRFPSEVERGSWTVVVPMRFAL